MREKYAAVTKLDKLENTIRSLGSVIVAYSGGVDSSFLLKQCIDILGNKKVIAVTRVSEILPSGELKRAKEIVNKFHAQHLILNTSEINNPEFNKNSIDRCYICKHSLFRELSKIAHAYECTSIIDGSNFDDLNEHRPGSKALKEFNIKSPLQDAGLTKKDVRMLSKKLNLPFWDAISSSCLATRVPYGEKLTPERLKRIDKTEHFLKNLGLKEVRVRDHNTLARIETSKKGRAKVVKFSRWIVKGLKKLGYTYITLDLEGYRSGSMDILSYGDKPWIEKK